MRARIDNEVLFIYRDDVPKYNKQGSIVRNSYFWALRSIAGRSNLGVNRVTCAGYAGFPWSVH